MAVTHFFHINYEPRESWIRPLMARIQQSPSTIIHTRWQQRASSLTELSLALATKFEILGLLIKRLNEHIRQLSQDFDDRPQEVENCIAAGSAYTPTSRVLAFNLIIDLDAFLFEFRSSYEVLKAFMKAFSRSVFDFVVSSEEVLKTILRQEGCDIIWIDFLNDQRNFFIHQTAPWIAIEVTGQLPVKYELIVLKRNTHGLTNPDDYVKMDEYRAIFNGFNEALHGLRRWFIREIEKIEARHP